MLYCFSGGKVGTLVHYATISGRSPKSGNFGGGKQLILLSVERFRGSALPLTGDGKIGTRHYSACILNCLTSLVIIFPDQTQAGKIAMKRELLIFCLLLAGCDTSEKKRERALQDAMRENAKCIDLRRADSSHSLNAVAQAEMEAVCEAARRMSSEALGREAGVDKVAVATPPPVTWRYVEDEDKLRGGKRRAAIVDSEQKLDLAPPYDGGAKASLVIRKTPAYGVDISIVIDRGQFICTDFYHKYVTLRFDDGKSEKYRCHEPSDLSHNKIFFTPAGKILEKIKKSKTVLFEVGLFQNGNRQISFDTRNLHW